MKAYLTADKRELAASALAALGESGGWDTIKTELALHPEPLAAAWTLGFCYAIVALESGAIQPITQTSDPQDN